MKKAILFFTAILSFGIAKAQTTCTGETPGLTAGSTSCVTFNYKGSSTQYTTVRAADGNVWMQQNLGSTQIATSATDPASYGGYFQWGRWQDGHEISTSETIAVPSPNDPSAIGEGNNKFFAGNPFWWNGVTTDTWQATNPGDATDINGCDPCKAALGNGWRLPTESEWTAVVATENITNIATAFSSNLKLPVAGSRTTSGSYNFVGARGYYWSSTASATINNYGRYFYYSNAALNPNSGGPRGQGAAVRCILGDPPATVPVQPVSLALSVQNNAAAQIITNGGTLQLIASILPATASQAIVWNLLSGNEHITFNSSGLVTAVSNGIVTIQAVSAVNGNIFSNIEITITNQVAAPATLAISVAGNAAPAITVNEGTLQLAASVVPASADQSVTWSITEGAAFASVNNSGLVTAIDNGTVTVQAVSTVNAAALNTIDITVSNQIVLPASVAISVANNATAEITVNEGTLQLTAAVLPANADQSVTWSITEGAASASVNNNGLITATDNGTVTVQAVSTVDAAILTTIAITISNQVIMPESIEITYVEDDSAIFYKDGTIQLYAEILPEEANQDVIWSISNGGAFATIDENGIVTATDDGIVTVQATSIADNTIVKTIVVTVKNQNLASSAPYCAAAVQYDVEPITNFTFAGINNATSAVVNDTPAYEDFTGITATVIRGQTYTLGVQGNTVGEYAHDVRVFIDWNQDDTFDMADEYYLTSLENTTGADGNEAVLNITVPQNAVLGTTRIRVTKDMWNVYEEGEFDSCTNAYYGQVEDYSLTVNAVAGFNDNTKTQFTLYPNPTSDIVTVQANQEVQSVLVYNLTGQLIATGNGKQINLSNTQAGVYMVKINFENGATATQKIIKK